MYNNIKNFGTIGARKLDVPYKIFRSVIIIEVKIIFLIHKLYHFQYH